MTRTTFLLNLSLLSLFLLLRPTSVQAKYIGGEAP